MVRGANARDRVVDEALDDAIFMGAGVIAVALVAPVMQKVPEHEGLAPEQYSVGVGWRALLAARVEVVRAGVVLVRRWECDGRFLEVVEGAAAVQDHPQLVLVQVQGHRLGKSGPCDPLDHLLSRLCEAKVEIAAPEDAVEVLGHVCNVFGCQMYRNKRSVAIS